MIQEQYTMKKVRYKRDSGVVSLEACIVLPIFVFLILFFYGFMFLFAGEQLVSHALIQSAVSLSLDSYATDKLSDSSEVDLFMQDLFNSALVEVAEADGETSHSSSEQWYADQSSVQSEVESRFISYLANGDRETANAKLDQFGVVNGIDGISFSECKVEDDVLTITIEYKQEYLMDAFGLLSYDRTKTITQKMW